MRNENDHHHHHAAEEEKTSERSVKVMLSGIFSRKNKKKKRSTPHDEEDSSLMMRRDKNNKNTNLSLCEMMKKLKHSLIKKEKPPQHDNYKRLLVGKKGKSLSTTTKDHFILERMALISQKRLQHNHHVVKENGDSDQRRLVSLLPGYSNLLSISASDNSVESETLAEIESGSLSQDSSHNFVTFEISQLEASDVEKVEENSHEERLPQPPLPPATSLSHRTEEYELVLEPHFIQYEISPARENPGEAKRQTLCNQYEEKEDDAIPMDEKERVFKYVKAVLDAIDSSWEELYLKTAFTDQILNPALFTNIPFRPSQLCDHELLFDSINELIFDFCRFPQWVNPRTHQVLSFSEVQKEVYGRLFPLQFADSVDQMIREDMDKGRNWVDDVRCELECIGFETSELILDDLLEQLILDL